MVRQVWLMVNADPNRLIDPVRLEHSSYLEYE
jgi:hypothetical protein